MPAYHDDLGWYDRDEAYGQHVRVEAFYPEVEIADLCAAVDEATATFAALADETATLLQFVAPEGLTAGSSPALGHDFMDAA